MIFATLEGQDRDGTLLVVSTDRQRGLAAGADCPTLQYLLDHWDAQAPRLQRLALELDSGRAPGALSIDVDTLLAPLPRAYAFLDGSAYPHHMSVIRQVRGAQMPDNFIEKPLMYQGCSDPFLAPTAPIVLREDISYGIDIEAEVVVITGDVPQGISAEERVSRAMCDCSDCLNNILVARPDSRLRSAAALVFCRANLQVRWVPLL